MRREGKGGPADRTLVSIAVVVLACLEPPFGTSLLSLGQKLAADLCQPSPGDAPYPLDMLSLLSVPVLEGLVDGQREVRDSFAVTGISKLRVGSGSPNENDFVDTTCW